MFLGAHFFLRPSFYIPMYGLPFGQHGVNSKSPSHSKIASKTFVSVPPTQFVFWQNKHIILCPCSKWLVWGHPTVKLHLKPLVHFHPPSLYPDTLTQLSMMLGPPLRAPNQQEMHLTHFPLSMLKVASMRPSQSKVASETSLPYPPAQSVSWHPNSTLCDHRSPLQAPKPTKNAPR